jgi:hypothetical protein
MIVTQKNIDDAIILASNSLRALYLKLQIDLEKGKQDCKKDLEMYDSLNDSLWLLKKSLTSENQDCLTTNDLWSQINFIRRNSCALPKKTIVIVNPINRIFDFTFDNTFN